jgi:uncharacterized membrane protein
MFAAVMKYAKSAAGSVIAKYATRISVAVPFVVALGFATAAITLMLVERFGAVTAYWIVAAGFTVAGLLAILAVVVKEQEEEVAEAAAEQSDAADAASEAALQAPMALLATFFATPAGASSAVGLARRLVGRNLPLLVLLAIMALLLLWPSEEESVDSGLPATEPIDPQHSAEYDRAAA